MLASYTKTSRLLGPIIQGGDIYDVSLVEAFAQKGVYEQDEDQHILKNQ